MVWLPSCYWPAFEGWWSQDNSFCQQLSQDASVIQYLARKGSVLYKRVQWKICSTETRQWLTIPNSKEEQEASPRHQYYHSVCIVHSSVSSHALCGCDFLALANSSIPKSCEIGVLCWLLRSSEVNNCLHVCVLIFQREIFETIERIYLLLELGLKKTTCRS